SNIRPMEINHLTKISRAVVSSTRRFVSMATITHRIRPLDGIKVVELAGLAPAPLCGLILADFGADVTLVEKPTEDEGVVGFDQRLTRGKKRITVDLKSEEGPKYVRNICTVADVLLDPFRPGVLEKLGLDPVELIKHNRGLIVARITGS
uniref:Alpha-methylacyl-CoA racemase n=1 Tax=Parascaris univalens TaxID=6257 RepID=A0A914ZK11_PARUN